MAQRGGEGVEPGAGNAQKIVSGAGNAGKNVSGAGNRNMAGKRENAFTSQKSELESGGFFIPLYRDWELGLQNSPAIRIGKRKLQCEKCKIFLPRFARHCYKKDVFKGAIHSAHLRTAIGF